MQDLLSSLSGENPTATIDHSEADNSIFFNPVYGLDKEFEKLLRDIGSHVSKIAFIPGFTNLIIDDEKNRMRSAKANTMSLSRFKGVHSFGPVGNCINSVNTGIPLSCHMSHHGENSTEITCSCLQIIKGVNNPHLMKFNDCTLHGDRGYNDDNFFNMIQKCGLLFVNTTKRR